MPPTNCEAERTLPPGGPADFIARQVASFRDRAVLLASYGAREAAEALQRAAEDLESTFRTWWLQELTVAEAASEAGYSEERLADLVREGHLERTGRRKGRIRVRRCDLPRKLQRREPASLARVADKLGIG